MSWAVQTAASHDADALPDADATADADALADAGALADADALDNIEDATSGEVSNPVKCVNEQPFLVLTQIT